MVPSQQVVGVVCQTNRVSGGFRQIWGPHSLVSVLCLMDGHVWGPHSVTNFSLSEVPLLKVIRAVLLMTWMDLGQVLHVFSEFLLGETLVDQQIILLVHSTVATLAGSGEDLETSSQSKKRKSVS